jgi:pilus assembly protein FimV
MLRKLAIAIAASGAMMSASTIHALGMGNIELDSALNQPLNARIKLLKASELENWEIKPDLASREEFEKSGVERVFFLNSLKFEVIRDGADVYVDVTSSQPVVEPFLNFLVQVDWPNGRLLREYTLLLDPPVFEEDSMPAEVVAPQEQSFEEQPFEGQVEESLPGVSTGVETQPYVQDEAPEYVEPELEDSPQSIPDDQQSPESSASPQSTVDVSESAQETYRVEANDTLWEVAVRTRSQRDISPQQAMLAIQDLNPDAFINGNINRLKKNQVLRVPSEEQMRSRSFNEAVAEVAFQNEAFSQRKAQLDATRKDKAMVRTDDNVDGKLTLLASGEASSETDRVASGRVDSQAAGEQSSIENELNLALENLDKSSRENQELRARLDAMEEQINTLQRLINLKDEQMVALQTGMAAPEVDAKLDAAVAADTPKPMEETQAGEESAKEPAVAPVAVESEVKQDLNFEKPAEQGTKVAQPTGAEVGAKDSAAPSVKPKPKPKFVYEPPAEEPFDVIEFAIENPQIPGAVLGALLLALLGISRARKKKEEQASEQELPEAAAMTGDDPLDHIEGDFEDDFDSEFSDLELGEDGAVDDFDGAQFDEDLAGVDAGLPESLDETDGYESTDVLGEVDVYLAYNRIEPAKALLEKTIAEQPGRMDLRLKMMEVLAQMDDEDGLNEQFETIEAQGSDSEKAQAADLKSRLGNGSDDDLSGDLSSDLGLGLDDQGSDDFSGLDLAAEDSELDFDLDGLDLDAPTDASLGLDDGVSGEESGLDFDMDLGSSDEL